MDPRPNYFDNGTIFRYCLKAILLIVVCTNVHWSVAVAIGYLFVDIEYTCWVMAVVLGDLAEDIDELTLLASITHENKNKNNFVRNN